MTVPRQRTSAGPATPSLDAEVRRRRLRPVTPLPWRSPLALAGLGVVGAWVVIAIFAPLIAPDNPLAQNFAILAAPSSAHWFGTDELGRDVFSRVLSGARITLPLAVILVIAAMVIGAVIGGIAGYFGGWVDNVLMRLADLVFAFPGIILAMAVAAALGPQLRNAVIAVVVVSWPSYARLVRSLVLSAAHGPVCGRLPAARRVRARASCSPTSGPTSPGRCWCWPHSTSATPCCCCPACRSSASAPSRPPPSGARWWPRARRTSTTGGSACSPAWPS